MSSTNKLQTIKGFADLYEPESTLFTLMEDAARRVFGAYGYKELRIPILEYTELFARGIGTETDVVQKEMFTFPDRKGRSLTLRPEATAGIMRSYIENDGHSKEAISKLFSFGPMFRYERPQKGRMRQFHQLDCECLGAVEPEVDAEVVLMLMHLLRELRLTDLTLELNTLGCRECRPVYKETLAAFLRNLDAEALCENCRGRVHTNPLRVLDCKVPTCKSLTQNAPQILEHVCPDCDAHFAAVRAALDARGQAYVINPRLVRGLDYYSRTTFEVISTGIGAQGAVAGGGRYDGLIADLGGPDVPGIGFACGMERLALLMGEKMGEEFLRRPDFYIAVLSPEASGPALSVAQTLRESGLAGEMSFTAKSLKSQMRQASRQRSRFCLLLGETELTEKNVVIKDMDSGDQIHCPLDGLQAWAAGVKG